MEIPIANLHTPEELLVNAEYLFSDGSDQTMRAAILESITALEAYVQVVVFTALEHQLDPLLVRWLEIKTKRDFESRLSVFTPVAMGVSVNKQSQLWENYKKAKKLRNQVTHSGIKVTREDVRFVIDTVYTWLEYLGSHVELEIALVGLKNYIEQNSIEINSERESIRVIADYFGRTRAAEVYRDAKLIDSKIQARADIILQFGSSLVVVEAKFSEAPVSILRMREAVEQAKLLLNVLKSEKTARGAVILFQKEDVIPGYESVNRYNDGSILTIVIQS